MSLTSNQASVNTEVSNLQTILTSINTDLANVATSSDDANSLRELQGKVLLALQGLTGVDYSTPDSLPQ